MSDIQPDFAAVKAAQKARLITIGLAGKNGGALATSVDIPITVAATTTALIQECHIAIGHLLCHLVETQMFPPRQLP